MASPLHIPARGTHHHAPPKQQRGWKSKFKTFFKRNHQQGSNKERRHGRTHSSTNRKNSLAAKKEQPLSKTNIDDDIIQFTQSIDENEKVEVAAILTTPTMNTTPSTLPESTTSRSQRSSSNGRPYPTEIPVAASFDSSPLKSPDRVAVDEPQNVPHIRSDPLPYRLGAEPLSVAVRKEAKEMPRTSTPQTASTETLKSTGSSTIGSSEIAGAAKLQKQDSLAAYRQLFSCGPTLMEAAASFLHYPDPEIPAMDESSVSSTSAEAELDQPETSEERRQRLWRLRNEKDQADVGVEGEQGMELIFFQEDEEDWSNFPWNQQAVQTEKVDKDIFLSFTEMGLDDVKFKRRERLDTVPEADERTASSVPHTPVASPDRMSRSSTAPAVKGTTPSRPPPPKQPQIAPAPADPIPLSRTNPIGDPNRESTSSDKVVTPSAERTAVVDRVSNIIKSVPNVFAKLAESATGPSSESQILLTRSSSQVTWVSHADDFAALDGRPMTEIVIPSPEGDPQSALEASVAPSSVVMTSLAGNSTVHAIRNAIFDSMIEPSERAESEHKEGEDEDLDAPLNPVVPPPLMPRPYTTALSSAEAPPILLSPSSLTLDSRFQPPLSDVPVRVPSDGEDHPDGAKQLNRPAGMPEEPVGTTPEKAYDGTTTPPQGFQDLGDDISDFEDDLFLEDSPPLDRPTYQPQPDTPGERRSLMAPRTLTMSSTMDDDDSVGLNALASPERRKMSGELFMPTRQSSLRPSPPTPPRKSAENKLGLQHMLQSNWDYSQQDMLLPSLTRSSDDGDSDSSSDNIDHLLLNQRPQYQRPPPTSMSPSDIPTSYEDASHSSIVELENMPKRTFSHGYDLDSVVETDIDGGIGGLFSCACWDIPPLIEQTRTSFSRRNSQEGLLENRVRSDDSSDRGRGRGNKKGFGGKMISLVRSTSNSFRGIWSRRNHAEI